MTMHDYDGPDPTPDEELRTAGRRSLAGLIALNTIALIGILCALFGDAFAAEYTRQGGTADFACCADPVCATVITQRAREWSAKDDCVALTDKDGVQRYVRQWPMRVYKSGTAPPPVTPPVVTSALVYSSALGGPFAKLDGVTLSGAVAVKVDNDSAVGPFEMLVDGKPVNTESAAPYWLVNDNTLFDTRTLANGAHTIEARSAQGTLKATVTVANVAPPPELTAVTALGATIAANVANPANVNVTLSWVGSAGATGYDVERCAGVGCTNFAAHGTATASPYINTNLPRGVTYNYRVRPFDATRKGPFVPVTVAIPTAPPPATGTATLQWTSPTTNTDGSSLTDLAGYRIVYGTQATALVSTIQIPNPSLTTYVVDKLPTGTWFFAVRAYTARGYESDNSGVATRVVP